MALRWFFLLFFLLAGAEAKAYDWRLIDNGLAYTTFQNIHAFRIDPNLIRFSVVRAKDFRKQVSTAEEMASQTGAILVINGGFFSPEQESLGLLIRNGKILNPMHKTPWWAVFQIYGKRGVITPYHAFNTSRETEMAIQAGPRLLINRSIPQMKFSVARRSGIGIQPDGRIVLVLSEDTGLSLLAFAKLFQKPESEGGFGCVDALNLDGGGSSQLYIDWNDFRLNVQGTSYIPNGIALYPRTKASYSSTGSKEQPGRKRD